MSRRDVAFALPDQTGRRWLVTGATHGLGRATAVAAARAGAALVLPVRNRALGEQLVAELAEQSTHEGHGKPGRHELIDLDLADLASERAAAAVLTGDIDVLINNAGTITRRREETADGFERVLGVNFLGPFAFTNLVLPRVRERVVIVGSDAHRAARLDLADPHARARRWSIARAYADSKLADLLWALALERRLRGRGVGVQMVHPGWVLSNMQSAIGDPRLVRAVTWATTPIAQPAESAATNVLLAATADLPACSYVGPSGWQSLRGRPALLGRSAEASDPELAERVWRLGVRETGADL